MKRPIILLSTISPLILVSSYSLMDSLNAAEDAASSEGEERIADFNPDRNAYFGDSGTSLVFTYLGNSSRTLSHGPR